MPPRRRVKSAMVDLLLKNGGLTVVAAVPVRVLTPIEVIAREGHLGDEVARMLAAAEWFAEMGRRGRLRGRMSHSPLVGPEPPTPQMGTARRSLARAYDAIGADCWSSLLQAVVWEVMPAPSQRPLLRAALHSLAVWLEAQKNPL